jgi:hypothetical protein
MENQIVTRSLKRQLNHVIIHEQMENGATINNNLNADQIDRQFITPITETSMDKKRTCKSQNVLGSIDNSQV